MGEAYVRMAQSSSLYILFGDEQVGMDFPKTGSGKHQQFALREVGNEIIEAPQWVMSMV
jgi:hypothetical protein